MMLLLLLSFGINFFFTFFLLTITRTCYYHYYYYHNFYSLSHSTFFFLFFFWVTLVRLYQKNLICYTLFLVRLIFSLLSLEIQGICVYLGLHVEDKSCITLHIYIHIMTNNACMLCNHDGNFFPFVFCRILSKVWLCTLSFSPSVLLLLLSTSTCASLEILAFKRKHLYL